MDLHQTRIAIAQEQRVGRRSVMTGLIWLVVPVLGVCWSVVTSAQDRPNHYFHSADMPPGAVGYGQLLRGGPLPGHFQPVEITAPEGAEISLAVEGVFQATDRSQVIVGMLVGRAYRLKITKIPFRPGQELFPSLEIINRLYPPSGDPARFPIPVELTQEELRLALRGQYVVRVIYLENPQTALPRPEDPEHQRYFDVGADQDPLQVADRLGRPMAILRIGSRVPELNQLTGRFVFQSPPWIHLPEITSEPSPVPSRQPTDRAAMRTAPRLAEPAGRQDADDQYLKRE